MAFLVMAFLVVGVLVWLALGWPTREQRRLLAMHTGRAAQTTDAPAADLPLVLDLLAVALSSGLPVAVALVLVGDSVQGSLGQALASAGRAICLGAELGEAFDHTSADGACAANLAVIRTQLEICVRTGAAVAPVLRAAAVAQRQTQRREAEARAGRLGVRLVLPLGVCALPAFIALAIVPVVISLTRSFLQP